MKSINRIGLAFCLISICGIFPKAYSKTIKPDLEFHSLKLKYPNNPIISLQNSRSMTITIGKNGAPLLHVKDEQVDMVLAENGADFSEGKSYFNIYTDIKKFEAYSLIPENRKYRKIDVSKLTKSTEFDDQLYYDDTFSYAYNFPATGKGVKRCTYSEYEISDPFIPTTYFFSRSIPVENSEISITMPVEVKLNYHLFGIDNASVIASEVRRGKMITYRWISHQPKVLGRDFLAPGIRYFRPHLIVQVASCSGPKDTLHYIGNINDLYRWMDQKEGGVNKVISPEITQMTDSLVKGTNDTTEKIRAIYKWVQNNIKYIAIEDGENGVVPREANLVLKRRYGDCKDKSSILTAMIRSIGQKASLASVGTRELPYKYSEFPSICCANHMVAVWWKDNNPLILDGTSTHNRIEDIPAFIQGKECIINLGDGKYHLFEIPISDASSNIQQDSFVLSIDHNLLTGFGTTTVNGEFKSTISRQLDGRTIDKQMDYWPEAISSASDKMIVKRLEFSDLNEVNKPLKVSYEIGLPDYIVCQENRIYVNMNIEREMNQLEVKEDRILPIEVEFKKEHQSLCRLKIPENMRVGYLPPTQGFSNANFGYQQYYSQSGNEIRLETKIYINTLLTTGKDIPIFRQMLVSLMRAYRQTIALTKK